MKVSMCKTMRTYDWKNLSKDLLAGLVIMAVSIPISMGYAQIAGLPAVYGLYGSVFPIVLFALFSTSPQFVFGVDAAPAALVGSALVSLGIEGGSKEAIAAVPVLAFFVAVWLLVFYLCRAGKLVNYISAPVMGGFISGICTTIILMQVPKLFGGKAGVGELPELVHHIWRFRLVRHTLSSSIRSKAPTPLRTSASQTYPPTPPIPKTATLEFFSLSMASSPSSSCVLEN